VSAFLPIVAVFVTMAVKYHLKSGAVILPALLFLLRITLGIWSLLFFDVIPPTSVWNVIGILMGIVLTL
jgi:hypothetical protein